MGEDKIEQTVNVSGNAVVEGDVTLIGKLVKYYNPAAWQDAAYKFISAHRYFLLFLVLSQIGLLILYRSFSGLYQIPLWLWIISAALLTLGAWCLYTFLPTRISKIRGGLGFSSTIALTAILIWQAGAVLSPRKFPDGPFGIAMAEIYQPGIFPSSPAARELSDQIYSDLCRQMNLAFRGESGPDPCLAWQDQDQNAGIIVRRIGTIQNKEKAADFGDTIGAEVVLWGRRFRGPGDKPFIGFEILDTMDRATNPDFPMVMPVTTDSTTLRLGLSELVLGQGEGDEQIPQFSSEQSIVISSFVLGLAAYLDQDFGQAVDYLNKAVDILEHIEEQEPFQGVSLIYYYLGKANHQLGDIELGQEQLKKAQELNPDEPAIPISLALGYGSLGDFELRERELDNALDLIDDYTRVKGNSANALYDRGLIYMIKERYEQAVLNFTELKDIYDTYYIGYLQLASAYNELGNAEEAIRTLNDAINKTEASGTNKSWAYLQLAIIYEQEERIAEAREAFEKSLELDPKSGRTYLAYAYFLENQGELDAAEEAFRQFRDVTPQKGWAYGESAHFYRRNNQLKQAIEFYRKAVNAKHDDPLWQTYLAEAYYEDGQIEKALDSFEDAVQANEDQDIYYVYAQYGSKLYEQADFAGAAKMFARAHVAEPGVYALLLNFGQAYASMSDQQRAKMLQDAQAALEKDERNEEWTYLLLAIIYEKENLPDEAREVYEKAITTDPESNTAYLAFAYFLENQGELEGAAEAFHQFRLVAPDEGWAHVESAHFYRRHDLFDEAISHYLAALQINNDDPLWHTYLAETYFADGQIEKALDSFDDAVTADENKGNYFVYAQYGRTLYELGDFAAAAKMFEKALSLQPAEYALLINLGQTYERAGDQEKARAIYERTIAMDGHLSADQIQQARDLLAALESGN